MAPPADFPPRRALVARLLAPWRDGLEGLDPRVHVVVLGSVLAVALRMGIFVFLGIYFHEVVGIPLPLVGAAFLAENVARGLVGPVAGALSDRHGRRVVLLASAALTTLVLPLFLLVSDPLTLFLYSLAIGLTQGGSWPAAAALLIDLAPPARRQTVLSLNFTAIAVGYTVGVLPAGFLLAVGGYGALALLGTLGYVAMALVLAIGLRGPLPRARAGPGRSLLHDLQVAPRDRAFLTLAGLALVFPLGIGLIVSTLAVYGADAGLTEGEIGVALAVNGPLLALLALPVNARIERTGPYRFLPVAAAVLAGSYLVLAGWPSFVGIALATVVFTFGELVFSAALPTAVAQLAPDGLRGAYQGAWGLVFSVASGSALVLSGLLVGPLGWGGTWIAWAAITALAGLVLAALRPRLRRVADERAAAAEAAAAVPVPIEAPGGAPAVVPGAPTSPDRS